MARQAINNSRATTPTSVPAITRIQVEGNDTVSFLFGLTPPYQYVRGMSQIMTQDPAYISYRYDTITISQVAGESFTFTVYGITDVGGNVFVPLTSQDDTDAVLRKTQEIYRLLVTSVFKGCCECGNTEPECSIQYTAGNGEISGTLLIDSGNARINYFTANNQDFTGFWPIIQDGSWIFIFSKTDPTVYGVFQLSNYSDGGPGVFAQFDITLLAGTDIFPEGTELCVDVTSVGGSLVQDWQDTLNISSLLTQNNTVDGGGFVFSWENVNRYILDTFGYQLYTATSGASVGQVDIQPGGVSVSGTNSVTIVGGNYIDIITPNWSTATAGMVLTLTAGGHVEYTTAGTGTISSIGLFMPPAFTVSTPNPLIANGDFTVTGAGTDLEYINGLGELATLPIYTVENGLHTKESPADPFVFHLGGVLIEDTVITATDGTDEYVLGIAGTANQDTRQPLSVSNLGQAGVALFSDYAINFRLNPSVEIIGDNDTFKPLLNLTLQGPLPNPGGPGIWENRNSFLSLRHTGNTGVGARMAMDYTFRNTSVSPNPDLVFWPAVKLIAEATNVTENAETSNFSIRMFDGGSQQDKMLLEGKGQLTLNEYGAAIFTDGTTNIDNALTYNLAVDNTGKVWKKLAGGGGGTVTSVGAAGLLTTTATNPFTVSGTVTTSVNENRLVGRWDAAGTGIMQEITLGTNLDLTALGVLNASGGGFDVQVNTTTIIPPATVLNLKSGTDIDVIHEGSGTVRFDWTGSITAQGLQDVIIVDNVLTQNNTVQGSVTSFEWKNNSFYEINPVTTYDPGTGNVPGYFKAWVGKYPPSYSELYVEAIFAQMKSIGATNQVVKVDTTGVYIQTPALGSASNGYVLTLVDQTTGKADWQLGGGGTYTVDNGLTENPTDNFQLGGPLVGDTSISGDGNTYSLTFDDMNVLSGSSNFKIAFSANDGTTTSSFALQPTIANIGCGVNGSGSASFADFTDTQSRLGYLTPTQTIQFGADATGLYVKTPDVAAATATAGQVLTLINATTGESEWADGGGGGGAAGGGRSYYLNGSVNQGTFGGIADMRQMSPVPISGAGTNFTISTNGYIQSFITNLGDPNKVLIPAGNWNFELWFRASNNSGTPSFYVELSKYDTVGGTFTSIATGSGAPEGITNGTAIDLYLTALSVPQTILATTDRLAVRVFVNNGGGGRTITLYTEDNRFSQIITSFPSGIQSLNGLTGVAQTFATPGTSGTAPSWTSTDTVHTIDIPLASAASVTAGLISKTEYDTFNGKVGPTRTISTTAPLSGGGNLSADLTLSIADAAADGTTKGAAAFTAADFNSAAGLISIDYTNGQAASSSNKGFLTSADWTRFDSFKTQTIGVTVDGSGGVITAGNKGYVRIPYACTITFWSIITTGGGSGASLSFDILRANNAIPTLSIVGGGTKPNVSGATQLSANTAPAGWTSLNLVANDILAFNVESGAAVYSWAILQLTVTRT